MVTKPDEFTHPYLGLTREERRQMLEELGIESVDELFKDVPVQASDFSRLPSSMPERDVYAEMYSLAGRNSTPLDWHCFLGGRLRYRYVPAAVQKLVDRGEFLTSYTPYQPEISQGMLQALFEYQSMVAELTELDVVNCSHYTQGTSLGEAAHMANRLNGRAKVVVCGAVNPERLEVLRTYCSSKNMKVVGTGYDPASGELDLEQAKESIDQDTALVYAESPNYFGIVEPKLSGLAEATHDAGGLFCQGFDLISLSRFKPPGENGADIAVGEGVGFPISYGGPGVGLFATKTELVRKAPGRLVGVTKDSAGRRGFVITLQTREQHIRREKATSNITTNSAVLAVAQAVYLALLGPDGLRGLAEAALSNKQFVLDQLRKQGACDVGVFSGFSFQDHVIGLDAPEEKVEQTMLSHKILGPLSLKEYGLRGKWLLGVSEETNTRDVTALLTAVGECVGAL
ncbi:MAG: aminomethyl-transferring glycine dehydrogenase subunit GcvPA [Thermoprotei archaeon]